MKNHWSEFEYDKLKLILHNQKVESILDVLNGKKEFDEMYPISIELHLTDRCNLKCPWCTDKELRKNLGNNKKEKIFELFDLFSKYNVGVTIEGGGEPTIHENFEEIIEYGNAKKIQMGLITNGVRDISNYVKYFKWIRVSLDASNKKEYILEKGVDKFEQVLDNINKMSTNRKIEDTHLGVGYVLTNRNHSNIDDLLKKLDKFGVDYIYIRPIEEDKDLLPKSNDLYILKKNLESLTNNMRIKLLFTINERLEKNNLGLPCIAHSLTCIINANGNVSICEKRRHDQIILGNINEDDFSDIWKSDFRKRVTQKLLQSKCQEGCEVCRITSFNKAFVDINNIFSKNFI